MTKRLRLTDDEDIPLELTATRSFPNINEITGFIHIEHSRTPPFGLTKEYAAEIVKFLTKEYRL